jgi:hypothetical protein
MNLIFARKNHGNLQPTISLGNEDATARRRTPSPRLRACNSEMEGPILETLQKLLAALSTQEPVAPPLPSRKAALGVLDLWLEHSAAAEYLGVWWMTYTMNEERCFESTKTTSKEIANKIWKHREGELALGLFKIPWAGKGMRFGKLCEGFERSHFAGLTENTIRGHRSYWAI